MRCYCDTSVLIAAHTMAETRCFNLPSISRNELMSLTEECAKLTGIPYVMDAYLDEAMEILNS